MKVYPSPSATMNPMNIGGMNPAQGGPVGGPMMMMMSNGAAPATPSNNMNQDQMRLRLNTYIYDYFLQFGYHDHARALARDEKFEISTKPIVKSSPGRRKDDEVNGVDDNAMDTDSKDDLTLIPNDLPRPQIPADCPGSAFLYDWFSLFADILQSYRGKNKNPQNHIDQYLNQTRVCHPITQRIQTLIVCRIS